jgi:DNA-directed RNA polymerase subunit H (RpoH/RPB5)
LRVHAKGEKAGFSKLTEKEVLEIRNKFIPKIYTQRMLAREYNVKPCNISFIINRKSWKHV